MTHNFIIDLVENVKTLDDLLLIKDKCWFLSNYKKDTTISAMVGDTSNKGAFYIIHKHLQNEPDGCFDFVKNNVKFWHFKTEETSQGEELYITMNSRGQQLADNETIRAIMFKTEEAKRDPLKWSKLWEEWQDWFWKNRVKNDTSADKGYNEFLSCISGLENYINNSNKIYSKDDFDRFKQISVSEVIKNLSLPLIERYMNCLKFIIEEESLLEAQYSYSKWLGKCKKSILYLFNEVSTNWFADIADSNRATEQNRMVFLWSILLYFKNTETLERNEFFRVLRLYYVRYNNNDRSVSTIQSTISNIISKGIFYAENLNFEELLKHLFLNSINQHHILEYEELIWEIEDHKFNINGKDVGGVNISYLFDFKEETTIDDLVLIKNKLYSIFPEDSEVFFDVQNILLYYGEYWHRVSPWYYNNYRFDNWRRIIRDRDNDNKQTRIVFKQFFNDFKLFNGTISEFLAEKRKKTFSIEECDSLSKKLCWYNQYLGNKMWNQGNYIAVSIEGYGNALSDHVQQDKIFNDLKILYNTKGTLKGGNPKKISSSLPTEVKKNFYNYVKEI